jgi:phosphoglycolate phosphatase-like HAD superfamily hydrolase/predicted amidophosphoribosyltransferase
MQKLDSAIFDLDNTLCLTDSLEKIRTSSNSSLLTNEVLEKIKLFECIPNLLGELKNKGVKLGLVTNSPRWYVEKLLEHLELTDFESIITYDEVGSANVKPSPLGINKAITELGLNKTHNIIYVGDDYRDFVAAYAAGVKPIAPSWGSKKPISQMPAAVLNSASLIGDIDNFEHMCLIADRCAESSSFNIPKKYLYFAPLNLDGDVVALSRDEISLVTFGRYFSQNSELTAKYFENHKLSQHIAQKETNQRFVAPEYWVDLMGHAMGKLAEFFIDGGEDFDVITVIPSKKGKNPRLENLLKRISRKSDVSSKFISDLFYFEENAQSLKTLGGKDKREAEIEISLKLTPKYINLLTESRILIIDDIITTGSTFRGAFNLINQYTPKKIMGLCLAKTVSTSKDYKECLSCKRTMRLLTNKKNGIHFWSCTGFYETPQCKGTVPMKVKDCPKCGDVMYKSHSRFGYYLSCQGYRKKINCRYTENLE